MAESKKKSCKEVLREIFYFKLDGKMISTDSLYLKFPELRAWSYETLKRNLGRLRKEKEIEISFLTRGRLTKELDIWGKPQRKVSKTYWIIKND